MGIQKPLLNELVLSRLVLLDSAVAIVSGFCLLNSKHIVA